MDWLLQERCNSNALAMELCLSWTNLSIWYLQRVYKLMSIMKKFESIYLFWKKSWQIEEVTIYILFMFFRCFDNAYWLK